MIPVLSDYLTPTLPDLVQVVTDIQAWARNAVRVTTSSVDQWVDKGTQYVSVSLLASERNSGVSQRLQEVLEEKRDLMKKWWGPAAPVKLYSTPGDGDLVVYLTTPVDTLTKQPAPAPNPMVVLDAALKNLQQGLQPIIKLASTQGPAVDRTATVFRRYFYLDKLNYQRKGWKAFKALCPKINNCLRPNGPWKLTRQTGGGRNGNALTDTWVKEISLGGTRYIATVVSRDDPALGALRLTLQVATV